MKKKEMTLAELKILVKKFEKKFSNKVDFRLEPKFSPDLEYDGIGWDEMFLAPEPKLAALIGSVSDDDGMDIVTIAIDSTNNVYFSIANEEGTQGEIVGPISKFNTLFEHAIEIAQG